MATAAKSEGVLCAWIHTPEMPASVRPTGIANAREDGFDSCLSALLNLRLEGPHRAGYAMKDRAVRYFFKAKKRMLNVVIVAFTYRFLVFVERRIRRAYSLKMVLVRGSGFWRHAEY